jgi:hemoglobin/transferrin/lactoferrin receptor protein
MKNILLLLVLVFALGSIALSQTIILTDQQSGRPIELATLVSESPRAYATTNAQGQADISAFVGAEIIEIRMLGYKTRILSFAALESADFKISLEVTNLNLDAVVIAASRSSQNTQDIPAKISTIPAKEVSLQNPQTAADLLGVSGEVFIQKSQQGGGSPMIRGFATNRLLYTIDGVRMNTAIFRGGNLQNVISLDPFAIENTEILFGAGSVIYGSDAIGGVMSFKTLVPQLSVDNKPMLTGKAIARYASASGENTGHFDVNVGWKKWAFVTSISSYDYGDLRQGSRGPDDYIKPWYVQRQDSMDVVITQDDPLLQIPSAYSQINMMQKVRFKPNNNWDVQYGFHYSETSPYGRYDRHNRMRDNLPRYGEWYYGPQKWMMNNLTMEHNAQRGLYNQMTLRLAQQSFGESRIDRSFNDNIRADRVEEVAAYSANLDLVKVTGAKNKVFYGFEYVMNDVNSTGMDVDISTGVGENGPSRYPQSTWQSIAAYVSDQYKFSERFLMQAGLRYNQFILDANFDTTFYPFPFTSTIINSGALTGSLGAVYRPTSDWVLSANLATAFRSPNVDDMGKIFDSEPGTVVVPNPKLEAEYAYNADLSIAKKFDDFLKIDLSAYYTLLENAMVRRDYTLNGMDSIMYDGELSKVQAIQNAAQANVYGLQAGLVLDLSSGFALSTDVNYQIGEEELDDGSRSPSRHAAPVFGATRLSYGNSRLSLEFYVNFQGKRSHDDLAEEEKGKTEIYALDSNGNTYAPAWYTLNFKGMYDLTDLLTIAAGLENITDQRYRPYSSGLSGPGRNFIISLKAHF